MRAVEVFGADEQSTEHVDTDRWVRLAEAVLGAAEPKGDVEMSLLFVDDTTIADLNKRFLGKDGPTDVLSFPIDGEAMGFARARDILGPLGPPRDADDSDLPMLLGDVVVCPAVARQNAPAHAGTYEDELALLVVHGTLHLLGLDHVDDTEAEAMEAREQELLDRFHRS